MVTFSLTINGLLRMLSFELSLSVNEVRDMFDIFVGQNAGEESVANIDKLRHANGSQSTADIRLKMQKVNSCSSSSPCQMYTWRNSIVCLLIKFTPV